MRAAIAVLSGIGGQRLVMLIAGLSGLMLWAYPVRAADPQVPWECSNYSEAAQTRCMNAFIEHQREQIERLEGQLQAQRATVDQLKSQLDRQTATATDLQQRLAQRALPAPPNPYLYSYVYPPVGLGIYLGRPWIYGPPFFYHPYWGPRFYGHWRRGW